MQGSRSATAAPYRSCRNKAGAMVCVFLSVVKLTPHSIWASTNESVNEFHLCPYPFLWSYAFRRLLLNESVNEIRMSDKP